MLAITLASDSHSKLKFPVSISNTGMDTKKPDALLDEAGSAVTT